MLRIIFLTIFVINSIVVLLNGAATFETAIRNKQFQKVFKLGMKTGEKIEEELKITTSKYKKTSLVLAAIMLFIFAVAIVTLVIFVPILIGLRSTAINGLVTYLLITTSWAIIKIIFLARNKNIKPTVLMVTSIGATFNIQLIIIFIFGWNTNLQTIVETIYLTANSYSNTLTILFPILYFNSLLLSVYLYIIWFMHISKKIKSYRPKLSHILILTVISSVIGLIYLFETGLDFSNNHSFSLILNLITVVLGSILIPSIFSLSTRRTEDRTLKTHENNRYRKRRKYLRR